MVRRGAAGPGARRPGVRRRGRVAGAGDPAVVALVLRPGRPSGRSLVSPAAEHGEPGHRGPRRPRLDRGHPRRPQPSSRCSAAWRSGRWPTRRRRRSASSGAGATRPCCSGPGCPGPCARPDGEPASWSSPTTSRPVAAGSSRSCSRCARGCRPTRSSSTPPRCRGTQAYDAGLPFPVYRDPASMLLPTPRGGPPGRRGDAAARLRPGGVRRQRPARPARARAAPGRGARGSWRSPTATRCGGPGAADPAAAAPGRRLASTC